MSRMVWHVLANRLSSRGHGSRGGSLGPSPMWGSRMREVRESMALYRHSTLSMRL